MNRTIFTLALFLMTIEFCVYAVVDGLEPGHYEIIEDYNGFEYLEETLKEYF